MEAGLPRSPILVLVNPQDIVNIASAVRIAKNFGIDRMRLVNPEVFDPYRIEGIAHNTADLVARIEILDSLETAVADCVFTAVLTARERAAKRRMLRPREAAAALVEEAAAGPVAIVAGREDRGLTNAELDLCHALVTISTDPGHRSLNLAQAIAIMAYEVWNARGGEVLPVKPHATGRIRPPPLSWRSSSPTGLGRSGPSTSSRRGVRRVSCDRFVRLYFEPTLTAGEASLMRAMGIEVVRYLERRPPGGS